jgi:hypothetical protein
MRPAQVLLPERFTAAMRFTPSAPPEALFPLMFAVRPGDLSLHHHSLYALTCGFYYYYSPLGKFVNAFFAVLQAERAP